MKLFRLPLIILFLSVSAQLSAQSLEVENFRLLEKDLTANTHGTMEYDQNGQTAALIKVVTLETGFVFDGGMLGIVKTVQKTGEMWVYVPFGLQRITIAHPELGVLRDYYFPVPIEKARTYELKLKTSRPERNEISIGTNVTLTIDNPMQSDIYLNGIKLATGSWKGSVAASTYLIEVKKKEYTTYTTTIVLSPDEPNRTIFLPSLELITGTVSAKSNPEGAEINIDGQVVGSTPFQKSGIRLGIHNVVIRKEGYYPYRTAINLTESRTFCTIDTTLREFVYLTRNNVYFDFSYVALSAKGFLSKIGIYRGAFNLEFGYLNPGTTKEKVYWITPAESWNGTSNVSAYEYNLSRGISANLGIGILLSKNVRITPQLGTVIYNIKGSEVADIQSLSNNQTTYVMSGQATLRMELSGIRHVGFTVSPSYKIPYKLGDLASAINENTGYIKKWCGGFELNAGIELYF